ncbi:hypothetical protein SDJN03_26089, partial [Cucurbita argyrosperma subsp. sororia]
MHSPSSKVGICMICDTSFLIFSTDSVVLGEWQQQLNHPSIVRWKNVRDIISEKIMAMPEQMKKTDMVNSD